MTAFTIPAMKELCLNQNWQLTTNLAHDDEESFYVHVVNFGKSVKRKDLSHLEEVVGHNNYILEINDKGHIVAFVS